VEVGEGHPAIFVGMPLAREGVHAKRRKIQFHWAGPFKLLACVCVVQDATRRRVIYLTFFIVFCFFLVPKATEMSSAGGLHKLVGCGCPLWLWVLVGQPCHPAWIAHHHWPPLFSTTHDTQRKEMRSGKPRG
jgi:hypothetical protein